MASNIKVGIFRVLRDLCKSLGYKIGIITIILFCISVMYGLLFGDSTKWEELSCKMIDSIPTLLGFLVAGQAIIMGLSDSSLKRLSETADDNEIPLKVIVASFTFSTIVLLFSLLISLFFDCILIQCPGCSNLIGSFVLFGLLESALSIFHVVFHLFSTSTHLIIR